MPRAILFLLSSALLFAQKPVEIHTVEIDGRLIAYTIEDGFATQGDIILGPAAELENYRQAQSRGERGARPRSVYVPGANNVRLWPNATMYYTMESDTPVQQNLLGAIEYWNTIAPFRILPRSSEPNYVTFRRITVDAACSSSVGMVGGQQFIGVTSSCSLGNAIHEIGHAFGLLHEQERADRDAYITVLYDNIDKRFAAGNFHQNANSFDAGYYDYDSIMHYPVTGFSRNFGDTIATVPPGIPVGQRNGLSTGDIDAISRIYGVIPGEITLTTTPSGLTVTVDGETVTTPRKFTWPPGSQHTVSVPIVQGTSPRYHFARWSDGGAATHTITASSQVTVYNAAFQRQFQVRSGVASGAGTVTMTPNPADGYLADRQTFSVKAVPESGSRFIRWNGTTNLGAAGLSVSATNARVQLFGGAVNYQGAFTAAPLHVVDSNPRGVQVVVDGVTYYTPVSFNWAADSTHNISTAGTQLQGNNTHRFTFREWEDGSANARTVTAKAEGATYTAAFLEEYLLTRATVGNGTIMVTPASDDGFYDATSTVTITAVPGANQALRYWVGDLAGNAVERTLSMDQQRYVIANFGSTLPWVLFNAASYQINQNPGNTGMTVAPGEIVSFFGTDIGPATAQTARPGADGLFPTTLGGVSVAFDQLLAPVLYAGPGQINVVVPYGLAGRTTSTVTVRSPRGNLAIGIGVVPTLPGLFTANGTGQGPVAALNEDGSVNSESNPAAPGAVVVLYGTGLGALERSYADGATIPRELAPARSTVYARFDKLGGHVFYAGAVPTLVNGAAQVNVILPHDLVGGGAIPVRLVAGTYASPPGTTIWVK